MALDIAKFEATAVAVAKDALLRRIVLSRLTFEDLSTLADELQAELASASRNPARAAWIGGQMAAAIQRGKAYNAPGAEPFRDAAEAALTIERLQIALDSAKHALARTVSSLHDAGLQAAAQRAEDAEVDAQLSLEKSGYF